MASHGGITPRITDAEMITLAVMQALLRFTSEARWLRHARAHLGHLFRYLPQQSDYNKRLRRLAPTLEWLISILACDTTLWTDDVWVIESTPIECGRSRETARARTWLATPSTATAPATRGQPLALLLGLRLHLIATLHGLPVAFALTGAKADEREVLLSVLTTDCPATRAHHLSGHRQTMIANKNYYGHRFETTLREAGLDLLRPARKGESPRPGQQILRPLRQTIESIFASTKTQLDLEGHGGRTITGVAVRVYQRLLAPTAAIWHNDRIAQPIKRSLIAYDH